MNKRLDSTTQDGFVSIIVCMLIMTILSLITIGFAQIMSREQRQSLDRQLSSQAFYAAESGVNDASVSIASYSSTSCVGSGSDINPTSQNIPGVRIACVIARSIVADIQYKNLGTDPHAIKIFPIHTTPANPDRIIIRWTPAAPTILSSVYTAANFPSIASWSAGSSVGALKVYFIPFANNDSRATLNNNAGMMILRPSTGGAAPNIVHTSISGGGYGATVVSGNCSAALGCEVTYTPPSGYTELLMGVTSLYQPNDVTITATRGGASTTFSDVQAFIDSTGRTTDVVRRIQVRKSLIDGYTLPAGGLEATDASGGICKRLEITNTGATPGTGCSF